MARCDCSPSELLCEDERAKRPHVVLVEQCPPNPEGAPAPLCASVGEDCSRDYLIANGLEGCCDGSCLPNDEGGRTCRGAAAHETLHLAECSAALENASYLEPVTKVLTTSVGTFEFEQVGASSVTLGAGGCLKGLSVTLLGADEGCALSVGASLVDGWFVVDTFQAAFGGCAGYTGADPAGIFEAAGETPFGFDHQGLSCESTASERTCFGGEFAFLLDGAIAGEKELILDEQLLLFTGGLCGQPSGDCPQP